MAATASSLLSNHSKYALLSSFTCSTLSSTHSNIINFNNNIHKKSCYGIRKNSRTNCASSSSATTPVIEDDDDMIKSIGLGEIDGFCKKWIWRGYNINYLMYPSSSNDSASRPALVLVHGFGASVAHWRR
ncbi:hypothetical protein LIER_31613 [Lithospermum erythrorhizon]|uniref:Chlorophyllase n=1 Tax=Lithospermum erythrorhizon TaxID=34254 RepID=A0AAV3RV27_LITER